LSAATTTDAAIADSTSRDGRATMPSAASDSVIECATVNDVTMRNTSHNAGLKPCTGCQRGARQISTAGSSNDNRNRMWSKPTQMCHTPSRR